MSSAGFSMRTKTLLANEINYIYSHHRSCCSIINLCPLHLNEAKKNTHTAQCVKCTLCTLITLHKIHKLNLMLETHVNTAKKNTARKKENLFLKIYGHGITKGYATGSSREKSPLSMDVTPDRKKKEKKHYFPTYLSCNEVKFRVALHASGTLKKQAYKKGKKRLVRKRCM